MDGNPGETGQPTATEEDLNALRGNLAADWLSTLLETFHFFE